jgi:hypothetical protein
MGVAVMRAAISEEATMRAWIAILGLLTWVCAGFGQPAPDIVWSHIYGSTDFANGEAVFPTPDGGFVICGKQVPADGSPTDGWLFRTNGDGILTWSQMYGGESADGIQRMRPASDGGYILCGVTQSFGQGTQAYLVKTNAEGAAQWQHHYGGGGSEFAYDVRPTEDGGYVFAGYTSSFGAGGNDVWLVKVNAEGTQQWARTFGGSGSELAFSMDNAPGGDYYLAGYTTSGNGWDVYVICTNATGVLLWARTYGGNGTDFAEGVCATSDGGLAVGGVSGELGGAWVIKLDGAGNMQWNYTYGQPSNGAVMEIIQLADAGFLTVGLTGNHPYDGSVLRLDLQGHLVWSLVLHNTEETWLTDVRALPDGGYIVAGNLGLQGGATAEGYAVRLAPDGPPPPEHHFISVPPTGLPYAVIVDSARADEEMLHPGDEIGIFDGDLCVGSGTLGEGWPLAITTWQGDPEQELPGFIVGHPMDFRMFVHEAEVEVPADPVFSIGDGTFGFGVYSRLSLSSILSVTQVIPLRANYFELISLNAWPNEPTPEHVFGPLEHLVAAYEDNGSVYIPPGIHTLAVLHQPEGYRLFTTQAETLHVSGIPLPPNQLYTLHPGAWQWISYPRANPLPIQTAMGAIASHVIIVQDDDGHAWIPSQEINTVGNLLPGKGYMVRVNEEVTFHFTGDAPLSDTQDPVMATPSDAPQRTGLPYAVVVHVPASLRAQGAKVIELYDGDLCVGKAYVLDSERTLVAAWQGVPEYGLAGFVPGDDMTLTLKDADGNPLGLEVGGDAGLFGAGSYGEIHLSGESALPASFSVSEGYPNPFNPVITFTLTLIEAGPVEFTVFNTLGQRVYSTRAEWLAGEHRYTLDTHDFAVSPVSSVYYVEIQHDGTRVLRKILLLR